MSKDPPDDPPAATPPRLRPPRRERAPTITIDTSAVTSSDPPQELHPLRSVNAAPSSDISTTTTTPARPHTPPPPPMPTAAAAASSHTSSPPKAASLAPSALADPPSPSHELHPSTSLDSRPVSRHNVSAAAPRWAGQPQMHLSVPVPRSRGNSVDSDDGSHSPVSYGGDTFIPSSASSQTSASHRHEGETLLSEAEALRAGQSDEADFNIANNPFAFSPGQLNKLLNPKSLSAFRALGYLNGLEKGLRTNRHTGLSIDESQLSGHVTFKEAAGEVSAQAREDSFAPPPPTRRSTLLGSRAEMRPEQYSDRRRVYSDNRLPQRKSKSFWELAWLAYNDKVLILLTVAAVVSLSLGIYQSVRPRNPEPTAWVEGVAIIVAIIIVVLVGAINDFQKERQFVKLNRKKDDRLVKVIRSGKSREISVHTVLVGDVVHLEPGDVVPVDGIFIGGHNVTCDESSATGESDLLRKLPADMAMRAIEHHDNLYKIDPFIISGSKVNEGVGTYMVTSTGVYSTYGRTLLSLQEEPQTTPLQSKLNILAEYIAKLGLAAGLILFLVTFIEFIVQYAHQTLPSMDPSLVAERFLSIFITAVTIVVVAVPEGLPLAVTLALAFATTRMLKDNNLVRQLRACETMGNATTICSDKTGTLTQNRMAVVKATIGTLAGSEHVRSSVDEGRSPQSAKAAASMSGLLERPSTPVEFARLLAADVRSTLKEIICANSTAFDGETGDTAGFVGSKTEAALLVFARDSLGMGPIAEERANFQMVHVVPFDSSRKYSASVCKLSNGKYRIMVTGASEIVLARCRSVLANPLSGLTSRLLTTEDMNQLSETIAAFASQSLRTIGLVYRDLEHWPPRGTRSERDHSKEVDFDTVFGDMTFLGVVGIKDPLRDGVANAVTDCQKAGVFVRMVTGDNMLTAKAIAADCGIFTSGGIVMEGPEFRKLNRVQMNQIIPRLQVLARSSPEDKRVLVKRLRELGETVAVTGDGTNDAPALKTADVGFSMGISGTEVAKEASDIILMDDNFASIVKAMMWGRAVNDSVKKFLQFQITVNITAVLLAFISAVSSAEQVSVITAVQLLWVNLIMDTFAALALATDPPSRDLLNRPPQPRSAPLITLNMWKMITGQAVYQLAVTLTLYYAGSALGIDPAAQSTLVFNAFVWMQVFNQYNCRRLDNNLNIFQGMFRNYFFLSIQVIICGAQVIIIFFGGEAFSVTPLSSINWGISLVIGAISMVVAVGLRLIPDCAIRKAIPAWVSRRRESRLQMVDEESYYQWSPAIQGIKEDLTFLKTVRGGRLKMIKYTLANPREMLLLARSRSPSRSRSHSAPSTPVPEAANGSPEHGNTLMPPSPESHRSISRHRKRSRSNSAFGPAAAMAGIVAGSIGGWSPSERGRDMSSFGRKPLQDRSDLEGHQGVEIHPDTHPDDPILGNPRPSGRHPPSQIAEQRPAFGLELSSLIRAQADGPLSGS